MKTYLKQILPEHIIEMYRNWNNGSFLVLFRSVLKQMYRYYRYYSKPNSVGVMQNEARMIFHTHQIEKGLSHKAFRHGFGHKPLALLSVEMRRFRAAIGSESIPYLSALSALREYVDRHSEYPDDLTYVRSLFSKDEWFEIITAAKEFGGSFVVSKKSKDKMKHADLQTLMTERHSVREYSNQEVTLNELRPVIKLAMRTPSVCNRQGTRVHVILDNELINSALRIQGGFNGYNLPPALLLITTDIRVFMAPQERNEGFVDGGLFSMSLLLALEANGLAACPLNTMMKDDNEALTRKILDIPEWENLVMYIAVGHFPDEAIACVSKRLCDSEIITIHNKQ